MAREPLTPEDEALLDRIATEVVRRRLEVPAIFLLETFKPLEFVGSQLLYFFQPLVGVFYGGPGYGRVAHLLERKEALERLARRIEDAVDAPPPAKVPPKGAAEEAPPSKGDDGPEGP